MPVAAYDVVMLVLNDLSFDGRVRNEAAALADDGWRVLVVGTQRADGLLPDRESLRGFDVLRVRYGRFGAAKWWPWRWLRHAFQAWQIIEVLRRVDTRAFHAHDLPALLLVALARALRRGRTRLVYDAHELYLFMTPPESRTGRAWQRVTRPVFMRIEGYLARRADGVITVSAPIARVLALWYGVPDTVVIHNADDPPDDRYGSGPNLRALVGAGRRCVVHTGDLTERGRCLRELVQAVALLPPDVTLVFLGSGESQSHLRDTAYALGIAERILFVPPVVPEQVAAAIVEADAGIVLLRSDAWHTRATLPNKLFEAVAAGLPVIASNVFALRRLVRRHELGVVVDCGDPAAIARGIEMVLEPQSQRVLRANVRAAQGDLNWSNEALRLRAFFREVLG